jgi:Fe-S cluster assembly protein SufD
MSASLAPFEKARAAQLAQGGAFASPERLDAWSRFVAQGLPGPRNERWKYTPVGALLDRPFTPAPEASLGGLALPPPLPDTRRLSFVNGRFVPSLSDALPPEVSVAATVPALPPGPGPAEDGLWALNRALFEEAVRVEVPAGKDGGKLELLHVTGRMPGGAMVHPRVWLSLGEGARLSVVERFVGQGSEAAYFVDAVSDVLLAKGAHLIHSGVQSEGMRALHLGTVRVQQGEGSRFDAHLLELGAALSRREVWVRFAGEGAQASVDGLCVPGRGQHHDLDVRVEHEAPGCTSRQRFRGLLSGTGRAVSTGRVHVHPDAQKTDAAQSARALLLSPDAEVDLRPHLEIHADDVKASHGATVGELNPDQLFYLRARGIPLTTARTMLTVAFARELLDAFPEPALRDRALEALEARALAALPEGGA